MQADTSSGSLVNQPSFSQTGSCFPIALIIAVFLVALLGSLPLLSRYHFDEGWYTNAAIEMVRSGDFLTPRYADGSARFRKPIVTYWVLAASYTTMGIGLVASRLPFLLAGGTVLWLTYRIARSATNDSHTGVAAAAILASNIEFMESATKSTPDILQCLFLTLSIWGAVEIIFQRRRESRWYALLYVGAGLAIATKGLLAVILLLFVWGYARFVPITHGGERRIVHWGWLGAGVVIALSWFIGSMLHGHNPLSTLLEDQVGERLEGVRTFVMTNVLLYVLTPFRFFAPWIVLLAIAMMTQRNLLSEYFQSRKQLIWFVLGWFLVNVAVFSLGNLMRSRYLLTTYPLLSVLIADLLVRNLQAPAQLPAVTKVLRLAMWTALGLGLIVAAIGWRLDPQIAAGGLLFAGVTGLLYVAAFRRSSLSLLVALSLTILAAFATLEQFIKPVFITSPARDMTRRLLELQPMPESIPAIDVRPSLVNQIRLLSGGRLILHELRSDVSSETLRQFPVILGSDRVRQIFNDSAQGGSEECGATSSPPTFAAIWNWLITGEREAVLKTDRTRYYVFKRQALTSQGE